MAKSRTLKIVSGIFIVGTLMVMFACYQKFYVEPFYQTHLPTMNPKSFFETAYGTGTLAVWMLVGFLWLVRLARFRLSDNKKDDQD